MTEEQIKEQLSRGFLRLVANRAGYKCKIDETDHGVDITLAEVRARAAGQGHSRLAETGRYIDLQLKCSCESATIADDDGFRFDLESKTYNDLVERQSDPDAAPLILVVFLLPDDDAEWLAVSPDELRLRRTGYWWRPALGAALTTNERTIRIKVPRTNTIGLDFVPGLYAECYP